MSYTVVVAGATSASGVAACTALARAGMRVAAVGSDPARIARLAEAHESITGYACDLTDPTAVAGLADNVRRDLGPVDGLIHLVGGWRGGKTLADQTDEDWDFLHSRVMTTLRNTTRAFNDDVATSDAGRVAIVSAESVGAPTAGGANYAAVKAAAETWTLAMAQGYNDTRAAAVVLVIKAFVDAAMRAERPDRKFPGFTDVEVLGAAAVQLFALDAEQINGRRLRLGTTLATENDETGVFA
ncbi:SDR family NAD(P)-dependent oxidoreductase [Zhihengliuella halotolerans]|uniref:Short subunit dehydrogenase n=1 Tax=Zhihengliuella halotolerans TaxID=370736 RepID=A0A4Q8AFD7_9MICC|nr:SDR family NAD(P)-dependent oxidoreductase [Zhihengliuella halotolerans]RZU63027.1 short subunit dehydrogenase [Zhihengliuella halotolerans]